MLEDIRRLKKAGQFASINRLIPYTAAIGLECLEDDEGLVTVLRHRDANVGNTAIPAVHGGVVAALLEHASVMQLIWAAELRSLPRIVNLSADFLRPCLAMDTFARGTVVKQGKRVANVRVEAWQTDRARPVAAAHAHFLIL